MMAHIGPFPWEELTFSSLGWLVPIPLAWVYARGSARLPGAGNRGRRAVAFAGGVIVLMAVFSPPAERAAEALFSAHMVQHLALLVVVPPLLLYGHAGRCLMMGLPRSWRRVSFPPRRLGSRAMSLLNRLPVVTVAFALVLWAWHVPALYDGAVRHDFVHLTEHATFLSVALLFWGNVLDRRRGFLRRSMLVFATAFHTGLLAAILVFAPAPLYSVHLHQTLVSITPLTDQELAGLIMWIPLGAVFMATLAGLILRGLGRPEVRQALDA